MTAPTRIDRRFAALKAEGRAALVTFVTAGDPDFETSRKLLLGLPAASTESTRRSVGCANFAVA